MNVSEAKSRFSELLSRAAAGERNVIQRRERTQVFSGQVLHCS
jgi:antitoxin (DNA-binding transcriptional repressor) of toxin-antitoxin stability system